jgi:hypothetical protein
LCDISRRTPHVPEGLCATHADSEEQHLGASARQDNLANRIVKQDGALRSVSSLAHFKPPQMQTPPSLRAASSVSANMALAVRHVVRACEHAFGLTSCVFGVCAVSFAFALALSLALFLSLSLSLSRTHVSWQLVQLLDSENEAINSRFAMIFVCLCVCARASVCVPFVFLRLLCISLSLSLASCVWLSLSVSRV